MQQQSSIEITMDNCSILMWMGKHGWMIQSKKAILYNRLDANKNSANSYRSYSTFIQLTIKLIFSIIHYSNISLNRFTRFAEFFSCPTFDFSKRPGSRKCSASYLLQLKHLNKFSTILLVKNSFIQNSKQMKWLKATCKWENKMVMRKLKMTPNNWQAVGFVVNLPVILLNQCSFIIYFHLEHSIRNCLPPNDIEQIIHNQMEYEHYLCPRYFANGNEMVLQKSLCHIGHFPVCTKMMQSDMEWGSYPLRTWKQWIQIDRDSIRIHRLNIKSTKMKTKTL